MNSLKRLDIDPTDQATIESIRNNQVKRNDDLQWFIRLLSDTEGPFTYMLDAPWGDVKTFFLKSARLILGAKNPNIDTSEEGIEIISSFLHDLDDVEEPFLPIYFNAWENDFAEDPITALLANMAVELNGMEYCREVDVVRQLASIIDSLVGLTGRDGNASELVKQMRGSSIIEDYERRATVRDKIRELADDGIIEVANKLVIFIDELDRCRPDFAVRLLEQTKRLFQSDRVVLVFAADSHQLANAVGGMYGPGFETTRFLERFFDYRLRLTPVNAFDAAGVGSLDLSYRFDRLFNEIATDKSLTIRDVCRVWPKFISVREYCNRPTDWSSSVIGMIRSALLPLLIFIEREDTALFGEITSGVDFDALYNYGRKYSEFISILSRLTGQNSTTDSDDSQAATERYREYMHDLCVFIYGDANTVNVYEAGDRIGLQMRGFFDQEVFKTLRFE